jgi:tetratricopeptide (TPR) repeat protein
MKTLAPLLALAAAGCAPLETEYEEAERKYREALQLQAVAKDPAEALPLFNDVIDLWPWRPEFFAARAALFRQIGRDAEAIRDYDRALELRRENGGPAGEAAALHFHRGLLLAKAGRVPDAERDFAEAVRHLPAYVEAWLERARCLRQLGRAEEAERSVDEARRQNPAAADAFYNEGVRILNLGRAREAEQHFEFAILLDPAHARAHVALGRVLLETRRFGPAAEAFGRAIAARPGDAELYYHRGNALVALPDLARAFADFSRAVELDPSRAAYVAARGFVHHRHARDFEKALEDFNRALELDPGLEYAWVNRGLLHHEMILLREAERDLRRALAIRATPEVIQALGRVLSDRSEFERAADAFRKALALCRDDALRQSLEEDLKQALEAKEKPPGPRPQEKKP